MTFPSHKGDPASKHPDWVVSTSATHHLTHDREAFTERYVPFESRIGSCHQVDTIVGIGTVTFHVRASSLPTKSKAADIVYLVLKNVLHVPSALVNVFSTQRINEAGYEVVLNTRNGGGSLQEYQEFLPDNKPYGCITMNRNHYVLSTLWRERKINPWESSSGPSPICGTSLLSFMWAAEEEQRWMELLRERGEFEGEYIDRVIDRDYEEEEEMRERRKQILEDDIDEKMLQELDEKVEIDNWWTMPNSTSNMVKPKQSEELNRKRRYEDVDEELSLELKDDLIIDDWHLNGFDFEPDPDVT